MKISTHLLQRIFLWMAFLFFGADSFAQINYLTTVPPFTGGNSSALVTFNVKATRKIKVKNVWCSFSSTASQSAIIWYKTDSINGTPAVSVANGWVQAGTATFTPSVAGAGNIVQIPVTVNIEIPAGATYAMAISSNGITYSGTGTTSVAPWLFYDANIHINMGPLVGYGGTLTSTIQHRKFNGKLGYEIVSTAPNNASVAAITEPTSFCPGTYDVKARIRNNGTNQISSVNVKWTIDGVSQTPIAWTSPLDTFGGTAFSNDTIITMGSVSFPTGVRKNIKVWTELPNGVADTMRLDDTASGSYMPGFTGTLTVGGVGANYPNLALLAADLSSFGVCGPVEIIVNPGTYSGKANFNNIAGVSAVNRITLRGTNKNTCILNDSIADAILIAANTNYFLIRDLTVINRHAGACAGIAVVGNAVDNKGTGSSVINCIVNLPNSISSPSAAIYFSGTATSGANHRMDSLTIDSNVTNGGYYGIVVYGNNPGNAAYNRGILIRNNTINNAYVYGLYVYYIYNPVQVLNNTISMHTGNTGTGYGLYYYYCQNSHPTQYAEIIGNRVINCPYMAMYIYYNASTATAPTKIHNNAVYGNMNYSTNYACYLYTAVAATYDFYHNTFHYNGLGTTQYGLYYYNSTNVSGINCKNNIFSIYSSAGTTVYPAYFSSNPVGNNVNYNIYYNARNTNLGFRGAAFTTATYKTTTTGGDSSFNKLPAFVSNTDIRLTDGCTRGVNLSTNVPTDIFGTTRSVSPSIGFHEFVTTTNDLTVEVMYNPSLPVSPGAQNLVAKVKNSGGNTITTFNISYRLNGGAPVTIPWSGTLGACDTALITFSGANQITIGTGVNAIKLYTSDPNASADGNPNNDTLYTTFNYYPPLNGTYTIGGATANFPTFADATNALQGFGISGPVNLIVNKGTYNAAISLNGPVYGSSAINTITFDGVNKDSVTINSNLAGAAFKINQVSYVKIRNLTVNNLVAGTGSGIALIGNTTNNVGIGFTVSNCKVNLPNTGTSTSYGIIVTGNLNGTADANQWADSVSIDSNIITGAYYGIQISTSGTAGLNAAYNRGHRIRNNSIIDAYYYGIRFAYVANPVDILNNSISMNAANASSYGIYLYYNQHTSSVPTKVINNNIRAGYAGLYYYYWITGPSTTQIYNNMVTINGSYAGMYLYTAAAGGGAIDLLHNTILTTGGSTLYGMYYYNSTGTNPSRFKNNIFAALSSTTVPAYFSTNPIGNVVNYNNYYNFGGGSLGFRAAAFSSSNYNTITTGGDTSFNVKPAFISNSDLRLNNACVKGVDLTSFVGTDIFNNTRSTTPVVGAHEAASLTNDLAVESFQLLTPVSAGPIALRVFIRNQSGNTAASFNLKYSVNGATAVTIPWTGTLPGCDTLSVVISGTSSPILVNGFNSIVLYTSNPNGTVDNNLLNDTIRFTLTTITDAPGNAIVGNGTNKYVKLNHNPVLDIGRNFTIEAWVNLADPSTRNQKIVSKTKLPTSGRGFIFASVNGQLSPEVWDSLGTKTTHTSTASIPANTWTHIALTWESGVAMKSYINGVLVANTAVSSTNPIGFSSSELAIGVASWDFGSFPVNGMVDEVRIWNTTLDTLSLRKNMHRTLPAGTPGLAAYFQFNEPLGSTNISDGVNGLQGTVIGSPYLAVSSMPAGGDTISISPAVTTASVLFKGISFNTIDPFDNNVDLVVNEVPYGPNALPTGSLYTLADRYWIVNAFGTPGTFTANINLTLPPNQINAADTALRLYNRGVYGNGTWTLLQTVNSTSISGGAVTFTGIGTLGQFTLASNGNSPLPVTLNTFGGLRVEEGVALNWTTTMEKNNRGFEVERAKDGGNFETISFVSSKAVNSNKLITYSFMDNQAPSNSLYYRLKQLDMDGKFSYSPIIDIGSKEMVQEVNVYPNPFENVITIANPTQKSGEITIYDMLGKKLIVQYFPANENIDLKAVSDFKPGVYFIQINDSQPIKFLKR